MKFKKEIFFSILVLIQFFTFSCSTKANNVVGENVLGETAKPSSFQKIAPLTNNAIKGRENLHENGWYFIPSSKKTLAQISNEGKMTALSARALFYNSIKERANIYPENVSKRMKELSEITKDFDQEADAISKKIYSTTFVTALSQIETSQKYFQDSKQEFVQGYISLVPTAEKDIKEIYETMKKFNNSMSENYSNLDQMFADTRLKNGQKISTAWRNVYSKAVKEFDQKYQESGEKSNSALAVWDIFQGYTIAIKEFAFSPLADVATSSGEVLANGAVLTGGYIGTAGAQGIVSTGMVLYTPAKLGYRVMSPSLYSGYLGTLGIASASASAPTVVSGVSMGAFTQVTAVTASTTIKAGAKTAGATYETANTAAGMMYDIGKGSGKAALYGMKSGVILGYTALTVIPAHLVLAVPDSTIILAWDGPRLVIARVKGNYKGFDNLSTGTVVDLEQAKKENQVEILTDDPNIINKVLDKEIQENENHLESKNKKEGTQK